MARLLSAGTTTATTITLQPRSNGTFALSTVNHAHVLENVAPAGQWSTIGVVFDGEDSLFLDVFGLAREIALDPIPLNGVRLGGWSGSLTTGAPGMRGQISEFRMYSGALSEFELGFFQDEMQAA